MEITGGAVEDLAISKDASSRSKQKQIHLDDILVVQRLFRVNLESIMLKTKKSSKQMLCLRFLVHNKLKM